MKILVFNDVHAPFHSTRLWELVLLIARENFDQIIINGDFIDAYHLNMHSDVKHPDVLFTLEDEFHMGGEMLTQLKKAAPNSKITFNAGNHEHRVDRWIVKHAKIFYNFLSVDKMLRLKELGIEYYPYNTALRIGKTNLFVQHSPPSYGQTGARTSLLRKPGASFIYGCTHRMQQAHLTDWMGNLQSVYFNGWLGSTSETDQHKRVYDYVKGHENWQNCFSVIYTDGTEYWVNQVAINNFKCVFEGNRYEA